jgi:8-oxo-dGTP diphosphatase
MTCPRTARRGIAAIVALAALALCGAAWAGKAKGKRFRRAVDRLARNHQPLRLVPPQGGWVTAGGVIIDPKTHKVLIVRNRKEKKEGRSGWTWPKGKVDPGESPTKTARRESREESGVKANVGPHIITLRSKRALRAYFLMLLDKDKGDYHPHETLDVRWVSVKRAAKMLDRGRDRRVLDALKQTLRDVQKQHEKSKRKSKRGSRSRKK